MLLSPDFPSVQQGEQHLPSQALVRTELASTHGVWQSDWGLISNQEALALAIFNPLLQSPPTVELSPNKPNLYLKGLSLFPNQGWFSPGQVFVLDEYCARTESEDVTDICATSETCLNGAENGAMIDPTLLHYSLPLCIPRPWEQVGTCQGYL